MNKQCFSITRVWIYTLGLCLVLCGCKDDPEPERTITKINGHVESFGVSTFASTLVDVAMLVKDDSTGLSYYVSGGTRDLGHGDNAMMSVSRVDPITIDSEFALLFDNDVLETKNNLPFTGVVEFYPNHGDDEIHLEDRLYGMKTITFRLDAESKLSLYTSDGPEEATYYMEHKEQFIEKMAELLGDINDHDLSQSGNQRRPLFVVCTQKQ